MHSCNYFASCLPYHFPLCPFLFVPARPRRPGTGSTAARCCRRLGGGGRASHTGAGTDSLSFSNLQLLQCSCRKWDSCDKTLRALQLKHKTLCYSDVLLKYELSGFGGVCEYARKSALLGKAVNTFVIYQIQTQMSLLKVEH
jgi:hypothetical protein